MWEKTGQEVLLRLVALGRERKWILSLESYHCPTWLRKTFVKEIYLVPLSFVKKQRKKKRLELGEKNFQTVLIFRTATLHAAEAIYVLLFRILMTISDCLLVVPNKKNLSLVTVRSSLTVHIYKA